MPGRRKSRKCTGCRRPCKDHLGPTGGKCQFKASALSFAGENVSFNSAPSIKDVTTPGPRFIDNPPLPTWPTQPPRFPPTEDDFDVDSPSRAAEVTRPNVTIHSHHGQTAPLNFSNINASTYGPREYAVHLVPSPPGQLGGHYPTVVSGGHHITSSAHGAHVVQSISRPLVSAPLPTPPGSRHHHDVYSQPIYQVAPSPAIAPWCQQAAPITTYGGHTLPNQLWQVPTSLQGHTPHVVPTAVTQPPGVIPVDPGTAPFRPPAVGLPTTTANFSRGNTVQPPPLDTRPPPPGPSAEAVHYWGYNQAPAAPLHHIPPNSGGFAAPMTINSIHPAVHQPGMRHNLDIGLEHIDQRTMDSALRGECISLEEFLLNCNTECDELRSHIDLSGNLQVKSVKSKRGISSVLKWLEAWVSYEMLMCKHYGYAIYYEMARYRAFIIGISQKFKFPYVAAYDHRHRQRLAQSGSFLFSMVDHDLYITIFDVGAVKHNGRCAKCASSDHSTSECGKPSGGNRGQVSRQRGSNRGRKNGTGKSEVCYNFQSGSCAWGASCYRKHQCVGCGSDAPQTACSTASCKAAIAKAAVSASS